MNDTSNLSIVSYKHTYEVKITTKHPEDIQKNIATEEQQLRRDGMEVDSIRLELEHCQL
jgi:hypothetical protein